jgi:transcriptional regulator with XRE-family HTH domain
MATASTYKAEFCARIKVLREQRGWSQAQMATALGIPEERYSKYERRSLMPHSMIEQFSLIVGQDVAHIMTGRGALAQAPLEDPPRPKRSRMSARPRRAS